MRSHSSFTHAVTRASLSACALAAVIAAPALGALPRTYTVQRVDSPAVAGGAAFGGGVAAIGDLNGDGKADFAVGQNAGSPGGSGQVFIFNGATGAQLDTIVAPDPGGAGSAALFGVPFVDRMPDIGICPNKTSGQLCTNPIATKDGVPELLIGARGIDVGAFNDVGRAYVYDGATRALMKRIDMPVADRNAAAFASGGAWYGRVVYAPAGLPPCTGNLGIGTCPAMPAAVAIGDFDGGGEPDIVVGASRYSETPASAYPGSSCNNTVGASCFGSGRAYVYRGEDVAGSDPAATLETAFRSFQNPAAQADDPAVFDVTARRELFANAVTAVGDVGACTTPAITAGARCPFSGVTTTLDGRPEVLISAFRVDYPINAPDGSMPDVGVNFLYDGASGALLYTYAHPEPQAGATFGATIAGPPVGDLGGDTTRPDLYIPAVTQNATYKAQGRGYVMSGDLGAFTSTVNFALVNDPTPAPAGNFSAGYAAAGNLVAQTGKFRNELLVGAGSLGEPGNAELVNDIHVFDPLREQVLQTIADPDAEPGSRFGADIAPLGDLNGDGFLDLLVSAPSYDGTVGAGQGRIYILRSDDSPAPPPPPPPPPPVAPPPPIAGPAGPAGPQGESATTTAAKTPAGRTIELAASRESLRRGRRLTLKVGLEAFADRAGCQAGQSVRIQRRRPGSVTFTTFATRRTSSSGTASAATRPTATYVYRALVSQTDACAGAASNRERVTVRR